MSPPPDLPASARCVVIGGGVGGASVAYHLARLGWKEIVLVEQHELTEGTTWHSAGFVGQLRSTISQTRLIMYSSGLYAELARDTGLDPGWRGVGGLRVATTPERMEELRRQASAAATYGLELELLTPAETADRLPLLRTDDLLGAAWLPGDGYVDPALLTAALAEGARRLDVTICTGTRVTGIDVAAGRVTAVRTDRGAIATEVVVDAAGAAAGTVAALAGASVPVVPMRHQYVVTEPFDPPVGEIPTVRDPDRIVYFRPELGGLLVGGYARRPATYDDPAPLAEPRVLFDEDMERFGESWAGALHRVPALDGVRLAKVVNGPEAFTPDGEFIVGETEVGGLWVAAGFCVHGIAGAGGVGKTLAEWIVDGQPEHDVAKMDVRRFGAQHRSAAYARVRALDAYSRYYDVVYPHAEHGAGRPLKVSPAYARLQALGAVFGEKSGWERANWFEPNAAAAPRAQPPALWAGRVWSPAIVAEALAARDAVALFDQSSFGKLDVRGPGAADALRRLCANDVARDVGRAVYTQLLNPRGGIEADLTVTRLAEDRFRLVTGTASAGRDRRWIAAHLPEDGSVSVDDVTGAHACFCLWGPRARDVLAPLTEDDVADAALPYLRAAEIRVGGIPVLAQRITYVGELGWELYCPAEYGLSLWDALWASGAEHGIVAAGYRAIDALRVEKGYRVWGADITPDTTPDEAGLGFAVRLDEGRDFLGRAAVEAQRAAGGPATRLRCLVLDEPDAVCLGDEPVRDGGALLGRVTSGGYGPRVERSIAFAYLPSAVDVGARLEVGVFDRWVGAEVVAEPLYDPAGERIRPAALSV